MIGSINCVYETPCGYCSKFDKKCNKSCNTSGYKDKTKEDEIKCVEGILNPFGVSMIDGNGNFKPANEVLTDVCKKLRQMRERGCSREWYELHKQTIFKALTGVRYFNELY